MIFGMSISTFTLFHVMLSLVGIVAGFVVVFGIQVAAWVGAVQLLQ